MTETSSRNGESMLPYERLIFGTRRANVFRPVLGGGELPLTLTPGRGGRFAPARVSSTEEVHRPAAVGEETMAQNPEEYLEDCRQQFIVFWRQLPALLKNHPRWFVALSNN